MLTLASVTSSPTSCGRQRPYRLHAGLNQFEAVEETLDRGAGAWVDDDAALAVDGGHPPDLVRREVGGEMGQGQIAAGRKLVQIPTDETVGVGGVRKEMHDGDQAECDRSGQVQGVA